MNRFKCPACGGNQHLSSTIHDKEVSAHDFIVKAVLEKLGKTKEGR